MNSTWYIYALTDPRDGRIRYVGKTDNLRRRLRMHLYDAMNAKSRNHRVNWVRSLMKRSAEARANMSAAQQEWQARRRAAQCPSP